MMAEVNQRKLQKKIKSKESRLKRLKNTIGGDKGIFYEKINPVLIA